MIPLLLANEGAAHASMGLHDQVIVGSSVAVVAVILITAGIARGQLGIVPKGLGAVYEHIFDWIDGLSQGFMGKEGRNYVPLAMSFFLFILISNWGGLIPLPPVLSYTEHGHTHHLPPFESPSSSYSLTLGLAILAFLAFNLLGLRKRIFPPSPATADHGHGHDHAHDHSHDHSHDHAQEDHGGHHNAGGIEGLWQWISHFWHPTPVLWNTMEGGVKYALVPVLFFLFLGLNIIEEVARILSLSLRLYGNIFGEHAAKENILSTMFQFITSGDVVYVFLSGIVWFASIVVTLLGGLAGFVQAMVFTMLMLSYIAHAVADEH